MRFDVMRRIAKRTFGLRNLFRFSYFISMASRGRKRVTKKRGRKLMKYLEVTKWVMLSKVHKRYSPPMGRTKTAKRMRAFIFFFEKNGKRMSKMTEIIVRGAWGTQSCNIP